MDHKKHPPRLIEYDPETIPEPLKAIRDDRLAEAHKRPVTPAYSTERRAPRYPFAGTVELVDLQSGVRLQGRITVLSLHGCGVVATKPFHAGTRVRVGITKEGAAFAAMGRVAYAALDGNMGIVFVQVERNDLAILETWISGIGT